MLPDRRKWSFSFVLEPSGRSIGWTIIGTDQRMTAPMRRIISRTLSRATKRGLGRRAGGTTAGRLIVTLVRCCSWRMTLSDGWTRSAGNCAFSGTDQSRIMSVYGES